MPLRLTEDAITAFAANLAEYVRHDDIEIYRGEHGRKLKYIDKYLYFIKDWLLKRPYGRRLLAFIGSKPDQVILADRLQAEIKRSFSLVERPHNDEHLYSVFEQIRHDDTSISIDVLNRALEKGIFIHNADINRSLRFAMEEYLSVPLPGGAASEVIIATETLSYGVNLAIDDVALLSLEFPASERNQEYGATPKLLSRCAFSNMCGRAGRLNQRTDGTTVYIWPITEHESSPRRLIEIFYNEEETIRSKIMHSDDKEAYDRGRSKKRNTLAPLQFTYPFVKAFLDGLRFTGGAPGLNGATRRNDASLEELEDEFTDHLLYTQENRESAVNLERLNESVKEVVTDSMHPSLELVKKSGRGYKITYLGSSIIDTGTEISTLEPLKGALGRLMKSLHDEVSAGAIVPAEVLLLAIVVQNEAHRQVISGMPEFRTEVAKQENRRELLEWIQQTFADGGFTDSVSKAMGLFLNSCDEDPRHAPAGDTNTELVHDASLRLFCGLLLWVSGHPVASIHINLKSIGAITGHHVEINTNFAAFADRISWKLMFLGGLMRFTTGQGDLRMLQTKARRLITRLRLGCAESALPFLAREGNRASPITRKIAHDILKAGATPKTISSGDFKLDDYPIGLRHQIRSQVRNYVRNSFHHLKNEFVYSASSQGADAIAGAYWNFADTVIRRFTEGDADMPNWPLPGSEDSSVLLQAVPGVLEEESPKVQLREEDDGLTIIGQKLRWEDDTKTPFDAVRWYVRASRAGEIIRPAPEGYRSVVVDFPWLLRAEPNQTEVLRISPAAFGILLTLITRGFFKDSISALEALSIVGGAISSVTLMDRLYYELTVGQLPDALFDAWAGYWDAE